MAKRPAQCISALEASEAHDAHGAEPQDTEPVDAQDKAVARSEGNAALSADGLIDKVCFLVSLSTLGAIGCACRAYATSSHRVRLLRHIQFQVPRFYFDKGWTLLNEWANWHTTQWPACLTRREWRLQFARSLEFVDDLKMRGMERLRYIETIQPPLLVKAVLNLDPLLIKALVMMGVDVNCTAPIVLQEFHLSGSTPRMLLERRLVRLFNDWTGGELDRMDYHRLRDQVLHCMKQLCETHHISECEPVASQL